MILEKLQLSKRVLPIVILIILMMGFIPLKATHFLGGEITWECLKSGSNNGKFVFTVKLYRACTGVFLGSFVKVNNPLYGSFGGTATISCPRISKRDVSYNCYDSTKSINCYFGNRGNVEEYTYQSAPVQINGIPDTNGSSFSLSTCCRPSSLIRNITGSGYYLRSIMFPYKDPSTSTFKSIGSVSVGATCFDSSPVLAESPNPIVCANTNVRIDLHALDQEFDSLLYDWTIPMLAATTPSVFNTGYSVTNQLPNSFQNAGNVAAVLNKNTGIVTFKTISPIGNYHVLGTVITAYKNGQKVAEVYRDMIEKIISCNSAVSSPQVYNDNSPDIEIKESSSTIYQSTLNKTYQIGSIIELDLRLNDVDSLPTNPVSKQSVQLILTGDAISDTPNNSTKCRYSPCAYIDSVGNSAWTGVIFRDTSTLTARFYWNTSCVNLEGYNSRTYHFKAYGADNWCPLPKDSVLNFSITLKDTINKIRDIDSLDASTGGAFLKWAQSNSSVFVSYNIFRKYNPLDLWTLVTSIGNITTTTYKDNSARTDTSAVLYMVDINGGQDCDNFSVQTIYLYSFYDTNGVTCRWNAPYLNTGSLIGSYEIWREDTLGLWNIIGTSNYKMEIYVDKSPIYNQISRYKVVAKDNNGLYSISNIDSLRIDSVIPGITKKLIDGFKIYPNPTSNVLTLEFESIKGEYYFHIIDLSGIVVYKTRVINQHTKVDISEIPSGLYFIKIENDTGDVFFKKIIKTN